MKLLITYVKEFPRYGNGRFEMPEEKEIKVKTPIVGATFINKQTVTLKESECLLIKSWCWRKFKNVQKLACLKDGVLTVKVLYE